jgi:hypothetical protein
MAQQPTPTAPPANQAPATATFAEPAFQQIYSKKEVPREEWASILGGEIVSGVQIERIEEITNQPKTAMFDAQCNLISQQLGGANPNVFELGFHTPKRESIEPILNEGLNSALSKGGFFGKGNYIAGDMAKAITYSIPGPDGIRYMFICKLVLGKTYEFPTGHFDRNLITAPPGYHSVKGFVRNGFEYVLYNNNQVLITHLITYKYTPPINQAPVVLPPAPASGFTVMITASMSEFFSKLQSRASTVELKLMIRTNIGDLLRRNITEEQFVANVQTILKATAPPGLADKIRTELAKCNLQSTQSTQPTTPPTLPMAPTMPMPMDTTAEPPTIMRANEVCPGALPMDTTAQPPTIMRANEVCPGALPMAPTQPPTIMRANAVVCGDDAVCADDEADGYDNQYLRRSKRIRKNMDKNSKS